MIIFQLQCRSLAGESEYCTVFLVSVLKWLVLASFVGIIVGAATAIFLKTLAWSTGISNGNSYYFHAHEGGIKCSACAKPQRFEQPISAGTVRTLLLGKDIDIDKIKLISFTNSLAMESHSILIDFISHVLGREVKSLKVMEQVRKLCP